MTADLKALREIIQRLSFREKEKALSFFGEEWLIAQAADSGKNPIPLGKITTCNPKPGEPLYDLLLASRDPATRAPFDSLLDDIPDD